MREKQIASIPATGPTPLDEIRQAEADAASQLFHAQQEAQELKKAAAKQALQMEQQAVDDGALAGRAHSEQKIAEARREAAAVVAEAQARAALLTSQGQGQVQGAVEWAVQVVLGSDAQDWQP